MGGGSFSAGLVYMVSTDRWRRRCYWSGQQPLSFHLRKSPRKPLLRFGSPLRGTAVAVSSALGGGRGLSLSSSYLASLVLKPSSMGSSYTAFGMSCGLVFGNSIPNAPNSAGLKLGFKF